MTAPTKAQLERARAIAEKQARDSFNPWIANQIRDGLADERAEVKAALAAIIETQEACAKLVEDEMPMMQCTSVEPVVDALQRAAAAIRDGSYREDNP